MEFKEYAKVYSIEQYWGPKDRQQMFPVYMDLRRLDDYPHTIDQESEYGKSMISEFYEKIMKCQYFPHPYCTPPGRVHRNLLTIGNGGHSIYFKDKELFTFGHSLFADKISIYKNGKAYLYHDYIIQKFNNRYLVIYLDYDMPCIGEFSLDTPLLDIIVAIEYDIRRACGCGSNFEIIHR